MKVGYIGLGNMGAPLAVRLIGKQDLVVFDPRTSVMQAFAEKGAEGAASVADLAAHCDIILMCLPTSNEVRDVIFGANGMGAALRAGTILIDQSTGDPMETRAMAADLAARDITLIDAPVSGGWMAAEKGTIAIMVGATDETYARVLPVLESISCNIFHAGGVGNGQVVKLVNNMMSGVQRVLSFEGLALAAKCGVDPKVATSILLASGGKNAYLEKVMMPRVLEGALNVGFTMRLAHKDLRLACRLAGEAAVPSTFGNLAREVYQIGMNEMGADSQVDGLALLYHRWADAEFVPADHDFVPEKP